jgi:uncharacterized protein YqhQ
LKAQNRTGSAELRIADQPDHSASVAAKTEYLQYGGQAIVEGVMMRSPRYFAVAVRAPNGEIVLQTEPLEKTWIGRQKWLKSPFLRGTLALLDAMGLGIRAMQFASRIQLEEKFQVDAVSDPVLEDTSSRSEEGSRIVQPAMAGGDSLKKIAVGGAMLFGLVFGVFVFVILPTLLGEQFKRVGVTNATSLNIATGLIKAVLFIGYLWGISKIPDIHRVFKYHGAEHKAINTLEAEQPLTMENCKAQTRLHPRCGTSFAIIVLLIDILALVAVPRYLIPGASVAINLTLRILVNLACLPIFAGIAYELIRFAGKFRSSSFVMALFAPGLATQYITTAEPDEDQIEVALTALRACISAEQSEALSKMVDAPQADETPESVA